MVDNQVNIQVNAIGNFGQIEGQLKSLRMAMLEFQKTSLVGSEGAIKLRELKSYQQVFDKMILSTRSFSSELVKVTSNAERMGAAIEKGNLSLGQYFKIYRENAKGVRNILDDIATQQARLAKSTVLTDPMTGMAKVLTPYRAALRDIGAEADAANVKLRLQNTIIRDLGTSVINLGKNVQWSGRQLTVGLTVPLAAFSAQAARTFNEVDRQLTRMVKVYGDGVQVQSQEALGAIRKQTIELATELAKAFGMSAEQTAATAADLAATGLQGQELLNATRETMRLTTLGELEQQQAIRATVALQRTFRLSSDDLADAVNYLNAVENQTSTSLQDIVEALPRASVVVKQLGGSYKDVAAMMVAMREAGVPAAEAANSIKSAMASIINPSNRAKESLKAFGIDIQQIVDKNAGDLMGTILGVQAALDKLDPLNKTKMIEEIFGKFQFAKVTALIDNLGKAGSQSTKAFELAARSSTELATLAAQELAVQAESVSGRWRRALESLKADFLPLGEQIMRFGTRLVEGFDKVLDFLNKFTALRNIIAGGLGLAAIVGPIVMFIGILTNFAGQIFKATHMFSLFAKGIKETGSIAGGLKNMSNFFEMQNASTIAASRGLEAYEASAESTAAATAKLAQQIELLTTNIRKLAGIPGIQFLPSGLPEVSNFPINPYYGPGQKIAGVERPHMFAGSELYRAYMTNPQAAQMYPNLGAMQSTSSQQEFYAKMTQGMTSQMVMAAPGAPASLQRAYGTEPVIYGGPTGITQTQVFERERQRLIAMHDKYVGQILKGTIDDAERVAAEQLMSILGKTSTAGRAIAPEEIAKLDEIISQVVFSWEDFIGNQVESLVQMESLLKGSEGAVTRLNSELQAAYSQKNITMQERLSLVNAAWSRYQQTLIEEMALTEGSIERATAVLTQMRGAIMSAISSAATVEQAALSAANIQAGISARAASAGSIYGNLLRTGQAKDSMLLAQSLMHMRGSGTPRLYAPGGYVSGPGGPKDDKIPAMLSNGEYVVRASSVSKYGRGTLDAINGERFAEGGPVGMAGGGWITRLLSMLYRSSSTTGTMSSIAGTQFDLSTFSTMSPARATSKLSPLLKGKQRIVRAHGVNDKSGVVFGLPYDINNRMQRGGVQGSELIEAFQSPLSMMFLQMYAAKMKIPNAQQTLQRLQRAIISATNATQTYVGGSHENLTDPIIRKILTGPLWSPLFDVVSIRSEADLQRAIARGASPEFVAGRRKRMAGQKEGRTFGVYLPEALQSKGVGSLVGTGGGYGGAGLIARWLTSGAWQPFIKRAGGGKIFGEGGPTDDKIPAYLSNGEYVVNAKAVQKYGPGFMDMINAGRFANGGGVFSGLGTGSQYTGQLPGLTVQSSEAVRTAANTIREETEARKRSIISLKEMGGAVGKVGSGLKNMLGAGKGGGFMAGLGLQMALPMVSQAIQGTSLGQNQYLQGGLNMAGTGAFIGSMTPLGPLGGALIGAGLGVAMTAIQDQMEKTRVKASALESQFGLTGTAIGLLGIKVKSFSDISPFLASRLGVTKTKVDELAQALKESGDQQTKDQIAYLKSLKDTAEMTKYLTNVYNGLLIAGVKASKAVEHVAALLQAADQGYYAGSVIPKATVAKTQEEAITTQIGGMLESSRAPAAELEAARSQKPGSGRLAGQAYTYTVSQAQEKSNINMDALGKSMLNLILTTDMSVEKFDALAQSLDKNSNGALFSSEAFKGVNRVLQETHPEQAKLNNQILRSVKGKSNEAEVTKRLYTLTLLQARGLGLSDVAYDAAARSAQGYAAALKEAARQTARSNVLNKISQKITGGSGGGGGTSAAQKAGEKRIKQIQDEMAAIQKQMEARHKLNDELNKEEERRKTLIGLANDVRRAQAKGDLLAAAAAEEAYVAEKNKQDREKAAEEADKRDQAKLDRLQKKLDKAQNQLSKAMSAASSAAGDLSEKAADVQTQLTTLLDTGSYRTYDDFLAAIKSDKGLYGALVKAYGAGKKLDDILKDAFSSRTIVFSPVMEFKKGQTPVKLANILASEAGLKIKWVAQGGYISGPGTATSDSIPAMLSNGEYVVKASSVKQYGTSFLDSINNGSMTRYNTGGIVPRYRFADGGMVNTAIGGNSVYNVTVNVAGTNASADEIANKVMKAIERQQNSLTTNRRAGSFR